MADLEFELKGEIETIVQKKEHRWFIGAKIKEEFGCITEMTVQFVTRGEIDMDKLVGQKMSIKGTTNDDKERYFGGIVVSVENIGQKKIEDGTDVHYVAQVRPWLWMLTRTSNNRIFQEKTAVQIIEEVFGDHGFADFKKKLSATYETRNYCVQYGESDYDFVMRLMEEEGIYHFYDTAPDQAEPTKLVLCDDSSGSHSNTPGMAEMTYTGSGGAGIGDKKNAVTDWSAAKRVISGKVTLNDFDMLTPKADLKTVNSTTTQSSHSHKSYELYEYPAKFRKDSGRGSRLAMVRMQAEEVPFRTFKGATASRSLSIGYKFKLIDEVKEPKKETTVLVTSVMHYIKPSSSQKLEPGQLERDREDIKFPKELEKNEYICHFTAIEETTQFRLPRRTKWPGIPGLHTATVVGKAGEEIWTDEHGRIKVQFHWDRVGKKDENSSCWVRVATPWSGKDWGMVAIPRIDQEVIIQFEEGDPDRPICTGMLWNADTKPGWGMPDNATQLGIRSNSSKGGGGYNELMFEDKKGEELVNFQAEKNYNQIVKNNATITIGEEKKDAGDMSLLVHNNCDETIRQVKTEVVGKQYNLSIGGSTTGTSILKGMATFLKGLDLLGKIAKVKDGEVKGLLMSGVKEVMGEISGTTFSSTVEGKHSHVVSMHYKTLVGVWQDQQVLGKYDQKIGLNHSYKVGGDLSEKVGGKMETKVIGEQKLEVEDKQETKIHKDQKLEVLGKQDTKIDKNFTTEVTSGNIEVDAKAGKITIKAAQSIELKVGASSVKIDNSGVTVKGAMIKNQATGMVDTQGKLVTMKADTIYTIKGNVATMIN